MNFKSAAPAGLKIRRSLAALAFLATAVPLSAARAEDAPTLDRFFSVTGHFLHNNRFYPGTGQSWEVTRTLPFVKDLGVRRVHEAIYALAAQPRALVTDGKNKPAALERNRKQVEEWLATYDKSDVAVTLAVVGYPPSAKNAEANNAEFRDWIADLLSRHKSVDSVQLHNEPNLTSYWPKSTAKDYVDVYRDYAAAIKKKRPDIKILVGAASSLMWKQAIGWMAEAGQSGLFDFADGIAVHPYNVDSPPEQDPHWTGGSSDGTIDRVAALQTYYQNVLEWTGGKKIPLYFTEFGWNTANKGGAHVDEATQAAYLLRSYFIFIDAKLRGVPIEAASWYDLKDDGQKDEKPEHRYGLLNYDLTVKKPSYHALKAMIAAFGSLKSLQIDAQPTVSVTCPNEVKTTSWISPSDKIRIVAAWSPSPVADAAVQKCELKAELTSKEKAVLYKTGAAGEITKENIDAASRDIEVNATPIWVEVSNQ